MGRTHCERSAPRERCTFFAYAKLQPSHHLFLHLPIGVNLKPCSLHCKGGGSRKKMAGARKRICACIFRRPLPLPYIRVVGFPPPG